MKVLWLTNVPLADVCHHWGQKTAGTGFWMHTLVQPLITSDAIDQLAVIYAGSGCQDEHFQANGVEYYTINRSKWATVYGLGAKRDESNCLEKITKIIEQFKPDLIHVHGTELFYGELKTKQLTNVPTVVSIQGLMGECAKWAWGDQGFWDMVCLQGRWDIVRGCPSLLTRKRLKKKHQRECQIIKAVDGVIGRTAWDRSYTWSVAEDQRYFHVDEMMRPEFFETTWSLESCQRYRVYTSGRLIFSKGMHLFLEAMALLKRVYPTLKVCIAGNNSPSAECRYLQRRVHQLGLADTVEFLGWIPASEIADQLKKVHIYANPSFIENGCNALQEAMLMSVPCVAPFAGGMATTLEHRKTGLMFPRGNAFMLADRIRELFENDTLAVSLGQAGRERSHVRHHPPTILKDLLACYQAVL